MAPRVRRRQHAQVGQRPVLGHPAVQADWGVHIQPSREDKAARLRPVVRGCAGCSRACAACIRRTAAVAGAGVASLQQQGRGPEQH